MGKYAFTLYLTHFVIENLIFSYYVTNGFTIPVVYVFAISIIISNFIAILIAYPTEMQYKKLSGYLTRKAENFKYAGQG